MPHSSAVLQRKLDAVRWYGLGVSVRRCSMLATGEHALQSHAAYCKWALMSTHYTVLAASGRDAK